MTQDTTPTSGAAIQRYKIGYHPEEWSQRSRTPSGIPDASGSWVRYADHVTALAAGQATAAQPGVAYAELPTSSHAGSFLIGTCPLYTADQLRAFADATHALRASQGEAPVETEFPVSAQAESGFGYKTAADFLSGKPVSDEALRKFVAASRGAHDSRAALHVKMLSLQGELASREAEISLLKRSLLDAEADAAAPKPPTAQADNVQEDAALLNWLEQHDGRYYNLDKVAAIVGTGFLVQSEGNMPQVHSTLREAVYAARKQGEKQ